MNESTSKKTTEIRTSIELGIEQAIMTAFGTSSIGSAKRLKEMAIKDRAFEDLPWERRPWTHTFTDAGVWWSADEP